MIVYRVNAFWTKNNDDNRKSLISDIENISKWNKSDPYYYRITIRFEFGDGYGITREFNSEDSDDNCVDDGIRFNISYNPIVLRSNNTSDNIKKDSDIARNFIKDNNLKVISCDYGCNNPVSYFNLKGFLAHLEGFKINFSYDKITQDASTVFRFYVKGKECMYVFGTANNGTEFVSSVRIPTISLLNDSMFVESVKNIDTFLYNELERFNLKFKAKK